MTIVDYLQTTLPGRTITQGMRSHFKQRVRGSSISAVAPDFSSPDYSPAMAKAASSIIYRSPIPSLSGLPIYILNAAALPDIHEVDYDTLLPYVLARLPGEDELVSGAEYEVILFAGGATEGATSTKKNHPRLSWFITAYHVLTRAMRKRIQKLYIVHQRTWVRMLVEMFSTIASPKFRKKIVHASTLSALALHIPIENLLVPPSAYLRDRQLSPDIHVPRVSGRRAFGARHPLPKDFHGESRLPRVLRETTNFILLDDNVNTEGLFRIPAHVKLKEILREAYDRGQKFIVWKERQTALPLPKYEHAVGTELVLAETDQTEAYGIHLAAGLIKQWYAELREPLFPPTCYKELKLLFGNTEEPPSVEKLIEMLSSKSEWSILPLASRRILTRHLLPLLSVINTHSDTNKMTPDNLAMCFAPTLICGPDQLDDMKVSGIIRRILATAIELWPTSLRDALGVEEVAFARDLQAPSCAEDYEDPLELGSTTEEPQVEPPGFHEEQQVGIILKDNDEVVGDPPPLPPRESTDYDWSRPQQQTATAPPPLPPRPSTFGDSKMGFASEDLSLRRKPAPPLMVPPRYSTVVGSPNDVTESPSTYTAVADGFAPPRRGDWSLSTDDGAPPPHSIAPTSKPVIDTSRQSSQLKRKPVTPTSPEAAGDGEKKK